MTFNEQYSYYKEIFEEYLFEKIDAINSPNETLKQAMKYSISVGGKRIRPILMLAIADVLAVDRDKVLPFATAIECIHTYSLIHDDLPAMDNDDLRRGKPTNHKVFGEAMAILAGDALLNFAYETILRNISDRNSISAGRLLALYAGCFGMVGGQANDILSENLTGVTEQEKENLLKIIHRDKTGRLLTASVLVPSCLAGNLHFDNLSTYGTNLGLLFQVTDDILDFTSNADTLGKSVKKDENSNKLTFVTLYGLDESKNKAEIYNNLAKQSLLGIEDVEFLIELVDYVKNRNY